MNKVILTLYIGGIVFWCLCLFDTWREWKFLKGSRIYEGTVVQLVSRLSSQGVGYRPKIRYKDENGMRHEHIRWFGSNPVGLSVGENVLIAVNAGRNEVRVAGFGHRFGLAVIFFAVGLSMLASGTLLSVGTKLFQKGSIIFPN